jgi:Ca2+-binding EF-hand superfamily protein
MTAQYQQQAMSSSFRFNPADQTAGMTSHPWTITPQERLNHEQIFMSLRPIGGKITGAQAKSYLMQSTLPAATLAHVWRLADLDGDGHMTMEEFSIAMHLIQCRLQGVELPQSLPPGLRVGSAGALKPVVGAPASAAINFSVSHPGMQMYNTGSSVTLPNARNQSGLGTGKSVSSLNRSESIHTDGKAVQSNLDVPWAVPASSKKKYNQLFNAHDRLRSGYLTGAQVRTILLQSNLSQQQLAQIWSLSDIDNDGRLSNEEFAVAMHLVDEVHAGNQLPTSLPVSLIPPSMRRKVSLQQQAQPSAIPDMPAASLERKSSFPVHTRSFEDKKRENFQRGQLELEKRRQERREKEQKEKVCYNK